MVKNQSTQDSLDAIPHTDDVVEYALRCVLALAPGLTEAIQAQIKAAACHQVRDVFGGERVYITRRAGEGRSDRNAQIRRDYLAGERIPLLERRYSLSARQIWNVIKT